MRELRRSMRACRAFLLADASSDGPRRRSSPTPIRLASHSIAWCATSVAATERAVAQLGPSSLATGSSEDWRSQEVSPSPSTNVPRELSRARVEVASEPVSGAVPSTAPSPLARSAIRRRRAAIRSMAEGFSCAPNAALRLATLPAMSARYHSMPGLRRFTGPRTRPVPSSSCTPPAICPSSCTLRAGRADPPRSPPSAP